MSGSHVIVIGFKSGDEAVLTASLAAWLNYGKDADIVVIGPKAELPTNVKHIEVNAEPGEIGTNTLIIEAAKNIEADKFIFALNAFPLADFDLSDIDKLYCESLANEQRGVVFTTGLPRMYQKIKVLDLADKFEFLTSPINFENQYFNHYAKNKKPWLLHDLSDWVRIKVMDRFPDEYRTRHLLKHKKFVVTNREGIKAISRFFS